MLPQQIKELLPAGDPAVSVDSLGGSGSNRRYWRVTLQSGRELIATEGTNLSENEAFMHLAEKLREHGVDVPQVLAVSPDRMCYLQTSVGTDSLYDRLGTPECEELVAESMEMLALAQSTPGIDYSVAYPIAQMDRRSVMWDLNYFKYCYLKTTPGLEIDEPALEDDFEALASVLLGTRERGLMIRDFQSRNVMIHNGHPALIDFQGGRLGPVHYDVASFLWQARANFSSELRSRMVSHYCRSAGLDEAEFRRELPYFVVFRLLQVLGAYGFRGRFEGKERFLTPIPAAVESLRLTLHSLHQPLTAIERHLQ